MSTTLCQSCRQSAVINGEDLEWDFLSETTATCGRCGSTESLAGVRTHRADEPHAVVSPANLPYPAVMYCGNSTGGLDGGADIDPDDDDSVYCEACGCEVDPALAVLDGDQMVCAGCAPCTVAEFERREQAAADAELDAREAALAARCDCFALGIEQPECMARGTSCDRHAAELAELALRAKAVLLDEQAERDALKVCPSCQERPDALNRCGCDYDPDAPSRVGLCAGSRVEVLFGPDRGKFGTITESLGATGYYAVALDEPHTSWPVLYFLPSEVAPTLVPPPVERSWANDGAYSALG